LHQKNSVYLAEFEALKERFISLKKAVAIIDSLFLFIAQRKLNIIFVEEKLK